MQFTWDSAIYNAWLDLEASEEDATIAASTRVALSHQRKQPEQVKETTTVKMEPQLRQMKIEALDYANQIMQNLAMVRKIIDDRGEQRQGWQRGRSGRSGRSGASNIATLKTDAKGKRRGKKQAGKTNLAVLNPDSWGQRRGQWHRSGRGKSNIAALSQDSKGKRKGKKGKDGQTEIEQ